ncbi:CoA pyrophosphatase [Bacterioplanes sanyensis]|uniref:CoA pyrophosphatase n=1 Tax=Bacterioplanes sanyensis TaxID=1249553 RepID=A0A222FNH5_9GAMM|nr:CoA pyrophosphatase [Bacterioplanes sanyensis]ASP40074.1 CoA pyrophosphatase [Bacterioplanes sanyensis]
MNAALTPYLQQRWQQQARRTVHQTELAPAAVLVAVTDEANPRLLLTQRSSQLSSHSGEVAFPGGKQDPEDIDLVATALREAHEEVALPADQVNVIGELSQVVSRFGYLVTPVLAVIPPDLHYTPNPGELDAVFLPPLQLFRQPPSRYFERGRVRIPSYDYESFHIWGLTAMMITEFMNHYWDCQIDYRIG